MTDNKQKEELKEEELKEVKGGYFFKEEEAPRAAKGYKYHMNDYFYYEIVEVGPFIDWYYGYEYLVDIKAKDDNSVDTSRKKYHDSDVQYWGRYYG